MVSPAARAMQAHWRRLKAGAGESATYTQDGQSATLTVVPGGRTTRAQNAEGVITTSKDSDFILATAELLIDDVAVLPKRRDKITIEDVNGITRKFEVVGQAGERHYDPVDQYGVMLRVHTVEIKGS